MAAGEEGWARDWLVRVRESHRTLPQLQRRVKQRSAYGAPVDQLQRGIEDCRRAIRAGYDVLGYLEDSGLVGHEAVAAVECYCAEGLSWKDVAKRVHSSVTTCNRWWAQTIAILEAVGWERLSEVAGCEI